MLVRYLLWKDVGERRGGEDRLIEWMCFPFFYDGDVVQKNIVFLGNWL